MKHWISAARPRTLPLALSSILMGSFLAAGSHAFSWTIFGIAVLTTTFLQILSNFANDYGDTVSGVDTVERTVATRAVQTGAITRVQMTQAIILMSVLSYITGSLLIYEGLKDTSTQTIITIFGLGILAIRLFYSSCLQVCYPKRVQNLPARPIHNFLLLRPGYRFLNYLQKVFSASSKTSRPVFFVTGFVADLFLL